MDHPTGIIKVSRPLTERDHERLKRRWVKRHAKGHPKLLTPLPRRVRLRLWLERQLNRAGGRLAQVRWEADRIPPHP